MDLTLLFVLNGLGLGLVVGAFVGYRYAKRKATGSDPAVLAKLAALEATESELRSQLARPMRLPKTRRARRIRKTRCWFSSLP